MEVRTARIRLKAQDPPGNTGSNPQRDRCAGAASTALDRLVVPLEVTIALAA
jgi:hypothetical protein